VENGAHVTVRRSKGREIAAACGQLRGKSERPRRAATRWCHPDPERSEGEGSVCGGWFGNV